MAPPEDAIDARLGERVLRALLEHHPYPLVVIDAATHRVVAGSRPSGLASARWPVTCHELLHGRVEPCRGEGHLCPLDEVVRTRAPVAVRHVHPDAAGRPREVEVHACPVPGEGGEVTHVVEWMVDVTMLADAEREELASRRVTEGVVDALPIPLVVLDSGLRVAYANRAFCRAFGTTPKRTAGRPLYGLGGAHWDVWRLRRLLDGVLSSGEGVEGVELGCDLPSAGHRVMSLCASGLGRGGGLPDQLLVSLEDVTERKEAERAMRSRLMRYRLEEGRLYLMRERAHGRSVEAFRDLLATGYEGTVISCTPEGEFRRAVEGRFEYLWLAEHGGERGVSPKVDGLERRIQALPKRSAVLIDRLDYVLFKNGLEATLSFVQHLRELACTSGHVIVLSLDPSAVDGRALSLVEKEAEPVREREIGGLGEELLAVVRFVHRASLEGERPTYSQVGEGLGVSKPTARRRIRRLIALGYLAESGRGAAKLLGPTARCRELMVG